MTAVEVGIVGLGRMGRRHLRVLTAIDDVKVVWTLDPAAQPDNFALGGTPPIPHLTSEAAAKEMSADVVIVAVPTRAHCMVATSFLAEGRTVFVEKPLAATAEEAERLVGSSNEARSSLVVGHVERFNPAVLAVRELLSADKIGAALAFSFRRVGMRPTTEPDVDVLSDLAVHDLDVCGLLCPRPLEVVGAVTWPAEGMAQSAQVQCRADGVAAQFQVNWRTPTRIREFTLTTEECLVEVNYTNQTVDITEPLPYQEIERFAAFQTYYGSTRRIRLDVSTREPLIEQAVALIELVRSGRQQPLLATGLDGLRAVRLADRARELASWP